MYLSYVSIFLFHRTWGDTFTGQERWSGGPAGKVLMVEREIEPVISVQVVDTAVRVRVSSLRVERGG